MRGEAWAALHLRLRWQLPVLWRLLPRLQVVRWIRISHYYIQFTGRPVLKSSFSRSCKTSTACSSALVGHNLIINYYNMLVIRWTSPGTSYLRIICFLRWIWLDWWTILQRNRCLHYCAVKSVWPKNNLLKFFYFHVKLLKIQLPINQIRCPSHYNSESPEALLCNEHMIQVVWYKNWN